MKHFKLSFTKVFIKFDIQTCMDFKYLKTNIHKTHTYTYKTRVHHIFIPSNLEVINWRWFCPSGDIWQCLETSLVFTSGGWGSVLLASSGQTLYKAQDSHPALAGIARWIECRLQTKGLPVRFPVRALPGLRARSPVGATWEATTDWYFSLSPSLPHSLKINK